MGDEIRFFSLSTGAKIPSVGMGTGLIPSSAIGDMVSAAIKVGYRHIDCAQLYDNEKEIGLGLKKIFEEGVVKREDLWITSKLWSTHHAPEDVPDAIDKTLTDLQLDYVDLFLIHWPFRLKKKGPVGLEGFNPENLIESDIPSTWRAMEAIYDSGKARSIGVSNFSTKKLLDLLKVARIPPAVSQVECHPVFHQAAHQAFCKAHGIHLSGYSPLGSPGWPEIDVLKNPILNSVAEKLGKTPAQVALRWGLQMGHSVIPKTASTSRIVENFDIFSWSIPRDFMAKLSTIEQTRLNQGTYFIHRSYGSYRTIQQLWDDEV